MTSIKERNEEPVTFEKIREMYREIDRMQPETDDQELVSMQRSYETKIVRDAEDDLFFAALTSKSIFAGQRYDAIQIRANRSSRDRTGRFDFILFNDATVAIIEVKDTVCQDDVEKMVTKQLPDFRALYHEHQDRAVYLGICSMSFDDCVIKKAHELGIGILRQKGDTIEADASFARAY